MVFPPEGCHSQLPSSFFCCAGPQSPLCRGHDTNTCPSWENKEEAESTEDPTKAVIAVDVQPGHGDLSVTGGGGSRSRMLQKGQDGRVTSLWV